MPEHLKKLINDYIDFPIKGIVFKDILPLLQDPEIFSKVIEEMSMSKIFKNADAILAIDARGFIFGTAISQFLSKPMEVARKPGKLPKETFVKNYQLEYGTSSIELHMDSGISKADKVVIVDDLVATGGTALAVATLVSENFGIAHENILVLAVIDIGECDGGTQISSKGYNYHTLFQSIL